MNNWQKWLWKYFLDQYPEHGYHPYFGYVTYAPKVILEALDGLWEIEE